MSDGDGHDGTGHGAHGAYDAHLGAPGSHHGNHDNDGHHGDKVARSFEGISAYHCHHDHYDLRPSFESPNDASPGHAPATHDAAVDPFSATVTHDEAVKAGDGTTPTRAFQVHVVNHSYVDHPKLMSELGDSISKKLFGNRVKFIRVDLGVPALDKIDEEKKELLSWNARLERPNRNNMPDGWVDGFTGSTQVKRQYWQLAQWNADDHRYRYEPSTYTWIECYWLVWRFAQTGTYETKLMLRVHSVLRFDPSTQSYGYLSEPFVDHQSMVMHLADEYSRALNAATPTAPQRRLLEHHSAESRRKRERGEGWFPAPRRDEQEMEHADQMDTDRNDKDPRHRENTSVDPPNAPPGDGGSAPPKPGSPAPAMDVPAEEGGEFDSGMGSHPPIVPMGIASGMDIDNVLPPVEKAKAEPKPDMSKVGKPSDAVWVPPTDTKTVSVEVALPK